MSKIPWIEYFRPKNFEHIILDPLNKQILKNIIETSYFPNLLFFGPPGTGKTTTIINLINAYQEKIGIKNKDLIIHLNASDERGIDIIRNQISCFVNSNPLFKNGMKFVILDEVDYMTDNAQKALRYLLLDYSSSVRFCLICNYISKIDDGLQNEFIRLRFNQLPKEEIIEFLKKISDVENLNLSKQSLESIQKIYKSDIRSMINFMQSNQQIIKFKKDDFDLKKEYKEEDEDEAGNYEEEEGKDEDEDKEVDKVEKNNNLNLPIKIKSNSKIFIIDNEVWEKLTFFFRKKTKVEKIFKYIYDISIKYNIDKKNIIKDYSNYLIRNYPDIITKEFLHFVENIMHIEEKNNKIYIYYSLNKLLSFL
jgi:replication factor C subunit 3/5